MYIYTCIHCQISPQCCYSVASSYMVAPLVQSWLSRNCRSCNCSVSWIIDYWSAVMVTIYIYIVHNYMYVYANHRDYVTEVEITGLKWPIFMYSSLLWEDGWWQLTVVSCQDTARSSQQRDATASFKSLSLRALHMYMLCAKLGFGPSEDFVAQSVDRGFYNCRV